jgi:hypothetical protein
MHIANAILLEGRALCRTFIGLSAYCESPGCGSSWRGWLQIMGWDACGVFDDVQYMQAMLFSGASMGFVAAFTPDWYFCRG